ncbi:MAG: hypothetical protein ABI766_14490 [Gemmatimonadales bacterium]
MGAWVALGSFSPLQAQNVAAGIVQLPRGGDTVAAGGARVLLHRVGRDTQGPIDSVRADRLGRFTIRFHADTTAIYLLSARFGGIEYFSSPVHTNPDRPDTAIRLMVYDTSTSVPVAISARHIVVPRPDEEGAREVLDLLVLRNDGTLARVAPDSASASWSLMLPAGSVGLGVGESDLSPDAVTRRGDSALILAPIAPGDKQVTLQYAIPRDRLLAEFPSGTGGPVNVLLEERAANVAGGTVALADSQLIEGRWFHRWTGRLDSGQMLRLTLPQIGRTSRLLLGGLVGALALVLVLAGWRVVSRKRVAAAAVVPSPDALLEAMAVLDARYAGQEAETAAGEWAQYQLERSRLKSLFESALAAGGVGR